MIKPLNIISLIVKTTTIFLLLTLLSYSQNLNTEVYNYIFPLPGSNSINPESSIIIRQGKTIDVSTVSSIDINVIGSQSGIHKGKLILSDDLRTIIFLPNEKFELAEEVKVTFSIDIKNINKQKFPLLQFNFFIKTLLLNDNEKNSLNNFLRFEETGDRNEVKSKNQSQNILSNYPEMVLNTSNHPTPGYIFLTLLYPGVDSYLMIMGNDGIPVYYNKLPWASRNLLLQPDGELTYFDHSRGKFFQMDSSYNVIDSFHCRNGFEETTQFHEFIHLENGHSFLMARDNRIVRMDTIVVGGDSAAIVSGFVIQELDANNNVIFQWNTFDHFEITDATEDVNLLAHSINPFHCNSLAIDDDGNLLLSSRYLDEVTKINRQTGEIIWRLGGANSANNEFQFINDARTFSHQHCVRRLANGNIILFDNGNLFSPQFTRVTEYELDEINKTATLIWDFANSPVSFTGAAGSVQRFNDENTLVGWGVPQGVSSGLTETDLNGDITLDFSYPENYTSYRAFKYSWKTNLFFTNPDSIFFESISVGDSATINFSLTNNSPEILEITEFFNKDLQFSIDHIIPFTIQPFQTEIMNVKFNPFSDGYFRDEIHIRCETDTSLIAQILFVAGRTDSSFSNVQNDLNRIDYKLKQNYPNPFNPTTKINYSVPYLSKVTMKVFDVLGNEIKTLVNEEQDLGNYQVVFDAQQLSSGIYYYQLKVYPVNGRVGNFIQTKKMILLK